MFSLRSTRIKAVVEVAFLALAALACSAQINPANQINWPTGSAGCVYAPGTNTCVAGGIPYPSAGIPKSTGSAWTSSAYTDFVALWASGSCSGFLKSDGTCSISSSSGCPAGWVCISSTATDWGTQINSAVTTLGANGGIIYFAPGSYTQAVAASVSQNNISIIGAGANASTVTCSVAGNCLTYQMSGSATNNPSVSLAGFTLNGNGTSGQIPVHLKDFRGGYLSLSINDSGSASPCLEFENVSEWTESNTGVLVFGTSCHMAVEMFQDNEANFSFGYNYLNFYVQVGAGQYGLYIPLGGGSVVSSMYNGSLTFTGDLSSTSTLIYNHGMDIGGSGAVIVPTTINVQTEAAGGTIWDVGSSFYTIFVSPSGINTQSASQGTAYSLSNKFYPYNSQGGTAFYLPNLASTNLLGTDSNGKTIAGTQFISSLTTSGTSGPATASGGVLNIPQYSGGGGGGGADTNITGSSQVTASGCTQSASTGGYCSISGSSTNAVTFSVIPGNYNSVRIKVYGQTVSANAINVDVTFNGDTSASYALNGVYQSGTSTIGADNQLSAGFCVLGGMSSTLASSIDFEVIGYADTSFQKTALVRSIAMNSISSATANIYATAGCEWAKTAAITSVTLTLASNDYAANTKFIVYGVN